jgi:AraC-like DNA-binding protein
MRNKTMTGAVDARDLQRQYGIITTDFPTADENIQLRYNVLRQGCDRRKEDTHFRHSAPLFCRLFVFFVRGAMIVMKGERRHLVPGKIWLIPPGNPFNITYYKDSELLYYHISVQDVTGKQVFGANDTPLMLDDLNLLALFKSAQARQSRLLLCGAAAAALNVMVEPFLEDILENMRMARRFTVIFDALKNEPPAMLRVEDLAIRMNMTSTALSKSFSRHMKIPLKTFLDQRTLEKGQQLLCFTTMSINQISETLGFNGTTYFFRFFRNKTGLTPARYRHLNAAATNS